MNTRQKILIVDDKPQNLYALERVLANVDADVIRADSGNDALIASLNHDFALALLDVQMPGMDGYELAEYLRDEKKTRNLPIVFLTAVYSDAHHVFKGYEAGAVDFVIKPYRAEILLAKVRIFLQLDRQRRQLEKTIALEKTKNHLENILLSMIDAVLVVSKEGEIQTVNDAALLLSAYASGEIVGMPFAGLFKDNCLPHWAIMDNPTFNNKNTMLFTKQGESIPVLMSGSVFHDRHNNPLGTIIVIKDIREQVKARNALAASEEKYRNLYETSRDGIAFSDMSGNIIDVNGAFLQMVGYELSELVKMNRQELTDVKWCNMEAEILKEPVLQGLYSDEKEIRCTRKDGSVFPGVMRSWVSRDENGNPAGIWMLMRDITEQKALEQQRIMTEKMTALGMLAGGMAHELNNPMMGIHGFIEYCLNHIPKEEKCHGILEDAARETMRCMDLVQNLLTFSHMGQLAEEQFQWVDCEIIFHRIMKLLSYLIEKDKVRVVKDIAADSRGIYAWGDALQQLFLNLMTNALDAVRDAVKKEIHFEVRSVCEDVLISIRDTGIGILPGQMNRIFDPFFTTKSVGKGTGLGLSISKSIVESHGGTIHCESTPGRGTRIDVRLPGKTASGHPLAGSTVSGQKEKKALNRGEGNDKAHSCS